MGGNLNIKQGETYEAKIYIGSREGYNGQVFTKYLLMQTIGVFQREGDIKKACTVRVSDTSYVFGPYSENGWEISVINYLRFPKSRYTIDNFALELAEYLMGVFKQNRISVVTPETTYLLEQEEAEKNPNENNAEEKQ